MRVRRVRNRYFLLVIPRALVARGNPFQFIQLIQQKGFPKRETFLLLIVKLEIYTAVTIPMHVLPVGASPTN